MASAGRLPATGVELALSPGMNANSDARLPAAQQRHHKAFVAAMGWLTAIGALVVYLGGFRSLLHRAALWLATCEQIICRVLGCP